MAANHFHSTLPLVDDPGSTSAVSEALDTTGLLTLGQGQGAQVTTRENAADAAERARGAQEGRHAERMRLSGANRPSYERHEQAKLKLSPIQIAGLAVAVIAVVAVLLFVFSKCASSVAENPSALSLVSTTRTLEADTGLAINYDGASYEFRETGGAWQLVRTAPDEAVLIDFVGKPVKLVIYDDDMIYVPENLSDGTWDVMAYLIAEDSVPARVPGASGEGMLTSAKLDGSELVVTDEAGQSVRIPLE